MAGIEEAFEKFSDRLAREETKRYSRDEQGDYREYLPEEQDQYPIKLGPLQLGANANMSTGKYSPNQYQNVSTMNRNVGLRGRYDVPDSGIALLGSIGDVRSNQNVKTNLPFNPMTGEASPYSEMRKDVYKDSPYSVGAQYTPQGTEEMYSALYNKGGGYNLGYNKGPINVSYTSNPGLSNNVMLRGQYNFAEGGRAGYVLGGAISKAVDSLGTQISEKLPQEQQQALTKINIDGGGGLGNLLSRIISKVKDMVKPIATSIATPTATPMATPAISIPTTEIIPPVDNRLTKPLGMAGFGGSEIVDILKRLGYTFADGGRVSMSEGGLTTTVPPAKGPDSQGVESLFRRRYS
jgi:hypothetical protein